MIIVLDTDVVVAAMRSPAGASAELLRMAGEGKCHPAVSVALALEYEAVLMRPKHRLAAGLEVKAVERFLDGLIGLAMHTEVHFRYRPLLRDPGDELVVEAAVNGGAEMIVTFNRRDFGDVLAQFDIECLLPRQALEKLR